MITDKVDFKRIVSQVIESSADVNVERGYYTLSAKIKNSVGFKQLELFAACDGKEFIYKIKNENKIWNTVSIARIPVKSGKLSVGFLVHGNANAICMVDDIELVKNERFYLAPGGQ